MFLVYFVGNKFNDIDINDLANLKITSILVLIDIVNFGYNKIIN